MISHPSLPRLLNGSKNFYEEYLYEYQHLDTVESSADTHGNELSGVTQNYSMELSFDFAAHVVDADMKHEN